MQKYYDFMNNKIKIEKGESDEMEKMAWKLGHDFPKNKNSIFGYGVETSRWR